LVDSTYDIYPILHEGKIYNLITAIDLTFQEAHSLIGGLEEENAFTPGPDALALGPEQFFSLTVNKIYYEVDVMGHEIIIYKRQPL